MKTSIKYLFYLIFLTSCAQSQTEKISGNPTKDLPELLKNQTVSADIMDGIKSSPRQNILTEKFQKAIQENNEWFMEYVKTATPGEGLKYHSNFGMSKEEYIELEKLSKNIEVSSSGVEKLQIIKSDSLITFSGSGRLSIYNQIKIDFIKNQIKYKDYVLTFEDEVNITDENNGFKSKWDGYNWLYTSPSDLENIDFTDLENLNVIHVKFTIGKLESNNKIYMQINEQKVVNGIKTLELQIPIVF
jgi:hypothetical protein